MKSLVCETITGQFELKQLAPFPVHGRRDT